MVINAYLLIVTLLNNRDRIPLESQPMASHANLELLERTMAEAEANAEAMQASIQEVNRNWNLL